MPRTNWTLMKFFFSTIRASGAAEVPILTEVSVKQRQTTVENEALLSQTSLSESVNNHFFDRRGLEEDGLLGYPLKNQQI